MFALRSAAARSSARVVPRLASAGSSSVRMAIIHPVTKVGASVFVSRLSPRLRAAYSTEVSQSKGVDSELTEKLAQEIAYEEEIKDSSDALPPSVKEFKEAGEWQITDVEGKDDVILTRQNGDEKITVSFSIVDLANYDDAENQYFEDEEMDFDAEEKALNESQDQEEGGEGSGATPCRLHIVIEKPGKTKSALNIEATSSYDRISIDSVFFYPDSKHAHSQTPETEFAAQELYPGPPFDSVDTDVQTLMDRFIEERGINQALAVFAADYMSWKEQREYVSWLKNIKAFVEA